jgi:hypothetical protein
MKGRTVTAEVYYDDDADLSLVAGKPVGLAACQRSTARGVTA